jgi:hypothetical protein
MFALSHIYTNMTFRLFTNIAPNGLSTNIFTNMSLHPVRGSHRAFVIQFSPGLHHPALVGLVHPVLTGSSLSGTRIPFGGTKIPTISPFTPAWDVLPVRSASGMPPACRVLVLWSAYLTRSPLCGSSSAQTLGLLPFPESSDTSARYASSGSGRLRSSQGGWHLDCRSRASTPLAESRAHP